MDSSLEKNVVQTRVFLNSADGKESWVKSVGDVVKINVDAALFIKTERYTFVCVARNADEAVMEAISCC